MIVFFFEPTLLACVARDFIYNLPITPLQGVYFEEFAEHDLNVITN